MSRTPGEHSNSVPDLTSENITRRKRGYNDDLTEALDQFSYKMIEKWNELKLEFTQEISEIKDSLKNLNETTNELKSEINHIREEYTRMQKTVQNLNIQQNDTQKEVMSLQKSMQYHSDEQDDLKKKTELHAKNIQIISTQLEDVRCQNNKLKSELNEREQRDRLLNIEIVGVPELEDEDLSGIILQLGKRTSLDIKIEDIVRVNRVTPISKQDGRPKHIVAKLSTRQLKDNLISQTRKCRVTTSDLNIPGKVSPVFVNEHLTVSNKSLLKKTKEAAKLKEYQYTWIKNCRIFVRKAATLPAIPIKKEEDLKKIV
ncbi:hypothetical protein SFRURICE_005840 [Spodoptera frugiperda]|nr:hypothetical protein SFRURICE_005840 [Spodoptera frugiperda]